MYNLLVCGQKGGWDGSPFVIERSRAVREYTVDEIEERFADFNQGAIDEIKTFPCLFAYENVHDQDAQIGRITDIKTRVNEIRLEYKFETSLPSIPAQKINELSWELDISDWEMNRTHWAIKDVDLNVELVKADCLMPEAFDIFPQQNSMRSVNAGAQMSVRPTVFAIPDTKIEADLVSVMMPFEEGFDDISAAISRACKAVNLKCLRADDIWEENVVVQEIFSLIFRSMVVICDFTGRNPNVFYEAGIAHTLGKEVIPIVQNSSDVPFDLRHIRFLKYLNNAEGRDDLTEKLAKRLTTIHSKLNS